MADPYELDLRIDALDDRITALEAVAHEEKPHLAPPVTEEEAVPPESQYSPPRGRGDPTKPITHKIVIPIPPDIEPAVMRALSRKMGTTYEPTMTQLRGYLEHRIELILRELVNEGAE